MEMKKIVPAVLLLIGVFILPACGTMDISVLLPAGTVTPASKEIETANPPPPQETQGATPGAEISATVAATPADTPAPPTEVPEPQERVLKVAFIKDGNVWLWIEGGEAQRLTQSGGVLDVQLSDDGQIIAFMRQDYSLWMIRSDRSDARPLVTTEDINAMVPSENGVTVYRYTWVPGTHLLAFNTRQEAQIGLILNNDFHQVNADNLERSTLLPPGEGGQFYPSPDGTLFAIDTSGRIFLMDRAGGNRREVFTYTPMITYSEVQFYAQPVWARDSSKLRVAIPPVDPLADPSQTTALWELYPDGRPAQLLATLSAASVIQASAFSRDLGRVAYLDLPEEGRTHDPNQLKIADLATGQILAFEILANQIYGWSLDDQHFAFMVNTPLALSHIGRLDGMVFPVMPEGETAMIDVQWVDNVRYLFLAKTDLGWDLRLGEIEGPNSILASVGGSPPHFDFVLAPAANPLPAGE